MYKYAVALASLAVGLSVAAVAQTGDIKTPEQIIFKSPLRAGAPAAAIIYGDPAKQGLYVTRNKFDAGHKNLPHFHPDERTVVVLSGTLYWAFGDKWDEAKLKPLPAGSFVTEPPNTPHFNWAKDGEVIIQVTGYGPSGATQIQQKQ